MADLASGDVTYTLNRQSSLEDSRRMNQFTLAFGDGAKTYPAGGIPILAASLGCPNSLDAFQVMGSGTTGYSFSYDFTNSKLIMIQAPAQSHSHTLSLKNAAVADGAGARVNAGTNLLGANTGSDISVAGGGANGGIATVTLAAAAGTEPSAVAIAAQSLIVQVVGW